MNELKVYELGDVADVVHVSYRTLLQYVKDKRLRAVKIGGRWKVSEENLRRFINGDDDERAEAEKRKLLDRAAARVAGAVFGGEPCEG